MEFLVTMTTKVPTGTTPAEVADMRAREALHTRALAGTGRILRLWRPPLAPGEWRSIGLFAATGAEELEATLIAMPLRVWRSDEVTPLGAFPNDPGPGRVPVSAGARDFLVHFKIRIPRGTSQEDAEERFALEAQRARELAAGGWLLRLWTVPGGSLGHWRARNAYHLRGLLSTLPLADWLTTEIVPLTRHPSDPGIEVATDDRAA
ncbi:muconolactone Delta-isomerase family protein [Actinoplanes sp. NPDC024001]|uniref:muconolactone Delta-isomerase family protein n=1 Tax=Actinoplanes sp. NPDC024001 TaxID=3154598 RepID=UPI0033FF0608